MEIYLQNKVIVNPTKVRTLLTAGMFLGEFVNLVPRFESKGVYIELERSGNQRIQLRQDLRVKALHNILLHRR
jgi:hypothetical protein